MNALRFRSGIFFLIVMTLLGGALQASPRYEEMLEDELSGRGNVSREELIVPGRQLGPVSLQMDQSGVVERLGYPDKVFSGDREYSLERLPLEYHFLYAGAGLSVQFRKGAVTAVTTFSKNYAFSGGISVGSTMNEVILSFGPRFVLEETAAGRTTKTLRYPEQGLAFLVSGVQATVLEITIEPAATESFPDLVNRALPRLDLVRAGRQDLIRLFGEPLSYRWGRTTFSPDSLPDYYVMIYPEHMTVLLHRDRIVELGFHLPGFFYRGKIEVGTPLKDAFDFLGPPREVLEGRSKNFEPGILYVSIGGVEGDCYYELPEKGLRLFFKDFKVSAVYLYAAPGR
ncbi:MAG TPA: hypothetical protein ENN69_05180 [Spirochaetia bacterium]|nr:hypothetical protein [Spirochaetia bacterium]